MIIAFCVLVKKISACSKLCLAFAHGFNSAHNVLLPSLFPPSLKDTAQCYFLSPAAALPNIHPVHLTRYLSPRSESCVHTAITALGTLYQNLYFSFSSRTGCCSRSRSRVQHSSLGKMPSKGSNKKWKPQVPTPGSLSVLFPAFLNLCFLLMTIKLSQADCAMLPQGVCSRLRVNYITVLQRGLISSVPGSQHEERKAL